MNILRWNLIKKIENLSCLANTLQELELYDNQGFIPYKFKFIIKEYFSLGVVGGGGGWGVDT